MEQKKISLSYRSDVTGPQNFILVKSTGSGALPTSFFLDDFLHIISVGESFPPSSESVKGAAADFSRYVKLIQVILG
ncbi:hypothetical protein RDI58_021120 [Solanum bulbocastanum]|uniref:Uncharacterized protein n=1 Tax=Solanum bulbocastanum TaxID=147425 RepID=A0AAN8TEU4_SOLBU